MAKTEREHRDDICRIGQLVFQKGWVAGNDGNITVRLDMERILTTPTGVSKGMMHPDDVIVVDRKGEKIYGRGERTSEIAMHLTIYDLRPDVRAVLHAHPPVATGFATAGRSLSEALPPEVVVGLGCVPLAGYGLPGSAALTEPLLPLIPKYDAVLMANHGAVCFGADLYQAYFRMETVEHFARIALVAELLGGARKMPRAEVTKLLEARARYGVEARNTGEPACPLAEGEKAPAGGEERFYVTRTELIGLVDEALTARQSS